MDTQGLIIVGFIIATVLLIASYCVLNQRKEAEERATKARAKANAESEQLVFPDEPIFPKTTRDNYKATVGVRQAKGRVSPPPAYNPHIRLDVAYTPKQTHVHQDNTLRDLLLIDALIPDGPTRQETARDSSPSVSCHRRDEGYTSPVSSNSSDNSYSRPCSAPSSSSGDSSSSIMDSITSSWD